MTTTTCRPCSAPSPCSHPTPLPLPLAPCPPSSPSLRGCSSPLYSCARIVSHVTLGASNPGRGLAAGLWSAPFLPWWGVTGAVNGERGDLWRGSGAVASPPDPRSTSHSGEDNMAAAGRNLPLEPRIKATVPDRNPLSNIQPGPCKQNNTSGAGHCRLPGDASDATVCRRRLQ